MILLDPGHGGLINGKYQTVGKRSPVWNDGSQLFEGEFNRAIVKGIAEKLKKLGIKHQILVNTEKDIPLSERVASANLHGYNHFYLSVHANAGGGKGFEIYTSVSDTKADLLPKYFVEEVIKEFPKARIRGDMLDGDIDKEANFYVLKNTAMPAVLTENFFMDNEKECKEILMTESGRQKIINYHVKAILKISLKFPELF